MKNILEKIRIYGVKTILLYILIDIKRKFWLQWIHGSYGQQGEDLIIDKLLNNKNQGIYADVGAYDPDRFSNTKRFYLRGWTGINIEPSKLNYKKFLAIRKRDINLNIGIGNTEGNLTYYVFTPNTLSTFSAKEAEKYQKNGYLLNRILKIPVQRLSTVLHKHLRNKSIDFFTIDTEGFDLDVLKSNDWNKFCPKIICIESSTHEAKGNSEQIDEIEQYLIKKGYKKIYDNRTNSIYQKLP